MIRAWYLALAAAIALASAAPATAQRTSASAIRQDLYIVSAYDPAGDPEAGLKEAIAVATQTNRNILLDVGGEWCAWCHVMDDYLATTPKVGDAFAASFVILKVNWDQEHENTAFLSRYPKIHGYPHFIVLDSGGAFLKSQETGKLLKGDSYSTFKMMEFAKRWARSPVK